MRYAENQNQKKKKNTQTKLCEQENLKLKGLHLTSISIEWGMTAWVKYAGKKKYSNKQTLNFSYQHASFYQYYSK